MIRKYSSSSIGRQMVRCPRDDRVAIPSAMIHLLPWHGDVDHGHFVLSCQHQAAPPKSVTVSLFQSRQPIQDPARVIGRQRALSLWHLSHGLLVASVLGKPKVTGGCDLRLFQRYWA